MGFYQVNISDRQIRTEHNISLCVPVGISAVRIKFVQISICKRVTYIQLHFKDIYENKARRQWNIILFGGG